MALPEFLELRGDVQNTGRQDGAPPVCAQILSNCWLTTRLQVLTVRPQGVQWKAPVERSKQWSPTFLAPGTGFPEDDFSMDRTWWGGGVGKVWG